MHFIILFGLAVAWGVLLVPDLLKRRGTARSIRGVKGFDRQLSAFNRTGAQFTPRLPSMSNPVVAFPRRADVGRVAQRGLRRMPVSAADAQRRRIYVLATLMAVALFTLALGLGVSKFFLALHFMADLALALYVYLLFDLRAKRQELYDDEYVEDDYDDEDVAVAQG